MRKPKVNTCGWIVNGIKKCFFLPALLVVRPESVTNLYPIVLPEFTRRIGGQARKVSASKTYQLFYFYTS